MKHDKGSRKKGVRRQEMRESKKEAQGKRKEEGERKQKARGRTQEERGRRTAKKTTTTKESKKIKKKCLLQVGFFLLSFFLFYVFSLLVFCRLFCLVRRALSHSTSRRLLSRGQPHASTNKKNSSSTAASTDLIPNANAYFPPLKRTLPYHKTSRKFTTSFPSKRVRMSILSMVF